MILHLPLFCVFYDYNFRKGKANKFEFVDGFMKARLGDYIREYSVRNKINEDIPVYSVTNSQGFCKDYFAAFSCFISAYACCQLVSDSCHSSLYARTAACGELACNAHSPRTPA